MVFCWVFQMNVSMFWKKKLHFVAEVEFILFLFVYENGSLKICHLKSFNINDLSVIIFFTFNNFIVFLFKFKINQLYFSNWFCVILKKLVVFKCKVLFPGRKE